MAARSPSTFTAYVDENDLLPRKEVITTEVSKVTDDQQFVLDVDRMIACDVFYPIPHTGAAGMTRLRTFAVNGRDLCGTAANENYEWGMLAWHDGNANFSVGMQSAAGAVKIDVVANQNSKNWRGWAAGGDLLVLTTAGVEDAVEIQANNSTGAGTVYIAGFCIFSGT